MRWPSPWLTLTFAVRSNAWAPRWQLPLFALKSAGGCRALDGKEVLTLAELENQSANSFA